MKEGLSTKHGSKLLRDALEQLLNGRVVANERGRHLESTRWDVADGRLDVVRDPLDKVRTVLVLNVHYLLVNLNTQTNKPYVTAVENNTTV